MWRYLVDSGVSFRRNKKFFSLLAMTGCLLLPSGAGYANDTSFQVNRANKTAQLPHSQWGQAARTKELINRLPKKVSAKPAEQKKKQKIMPSALNISATSQRVLGTVKDEPIGRALRNFYRALNNLTTGKRTDPVTILHLGDDHIARDRFTGDLREMFQARFGDAGRGMIMPGPVFPFFRAKGVRFTSSGKWNSTNSLEGQGGLFGITASAFSSSDPKAFVQMSSASGKPFSWAEVSFMTGPENGRAVLWVQGPENAASRLQGKQDSHQQIIETNTRQYSMRRVRFPSPATALSVFPEGNKPITLLSWQVGYDRPGVRYVNLALPKATAGLAQNLDAEFVKKDIDSLKPDLIVLGFGTNEGFKNNLDVATYEREFARLISNLRNLAPKASVMVIGPPDIAYLPPFARSATSASKACGALSQTEMNIYNKMMQSRDTRLARWHPPLKLGDVRMALQRAAKETGSFFWDWSKIMGGACGIHTWVHSNPKLAANDHRTLTDTGAKKSARSLYSELMTGFDVYKLVKR